jgi:guanylate kinase
MDLNFDEFKGRVILISGASGSGKGTMIRKLLERHKDFVWSVSATSRTPIREGEVEGKDYYFKDDEEFKAMIERDEFFEWAINHRAFYYGTPKEPVLDALAMGKTIVMEINYEGFLNVKKILPKRILRSIFILPPPVEVLKRRILERADMSEEDLNNRVEYSLKKEMEVAPEYDFRFRPVDGDIEKSFEMFEKLALGDYSKNVN